MVYIPIAEDGWFISECSCKRIEQLLVPRNATDMREKHGREKTITPKWWEMVYLYFPFANMNTLQNLVIMSELL